jgi:hypothetical protein
VVSENDDAREAVAERLMGAGFVVQCAGGAQAATGVVQTWAPDVVVVEHAVRHPLGEAVVGIVAEADSGRRPIVVSIGPSVDPPNEPDGRAAASRCFTVVQARPSGDEIADAVRALVSEPDAS